MRNSQVHRSSQTLPIPSVSAFNLSSSVGFSIIYTHITSSENKQLETKSVCRYKRLYTHNELSVLFSTNKHINNALSLPFPSANSLHVIFRQQIYHYSSYNISHLFIQHCNLQYRNTCSIFTTDMHTHSYTVSHKRNYLSKISPIVSLQLRAQLWSPVNLSSWHGHVCS